MIVRIKIILSTIFLISNILNTNAQDSWDKFFDKTDQFLKKYVKDGSLNYNAIQKQKKDLEELTDIVANIKIGNRSEAELKAFYINAYNLFVIEAVVESYPKGSVQEINNFFDRKIHTLAGQKVSLNQLERNFLLAKYKDARLHFVLVCGAVACPPITDFAYRNENLEVQLDQQTRLALDDNQFIQVDSLSETVYISEIFKWYVDDFKPNIRKFINKYRSNPIPKSYNISYYNYDWSLNDIEDESKSELSEKNKKFAPIVASTTLPKGKVELKLFNGIYTAKYGIGIEGVQSRSSFMSAFIQNSYGITGNLDVGIDLIIKSNIMNDLGSNSPFKTFLFQNRSYIQSGQTADGQSYDLETQSVFGLGHIGPRVRWAPFRKLPNFSFQQAFYIPIQKHVDGTFTWVSQFFYAHDIGSKGQIFVDLTIWQPLGQRLNLPFLKAFLSWFPHKRVTLYATSTLLVEWGAGAKFLLTPNFELEFLFTRYLPFKFVNNRFGTAATTYNFGIRYRI